MDVWYGQLLVDVYMRYVGKYNKMQHVSGLLAQGQLFIEGKQFFHYHGLVLSLLWFLAAPLGILLRKVSVLAHATAFFLIDVTTLFFIVGALLRVYPYFGYFSQWNIIKQGHIAAGSLFLGLLVLQHVGGVITLLKKMPSNPAHRKLGVLVSNFGRIVAVFGMVLANQEKQIIYGAIALALIMLVVSFQRQFFRSPSAQKEIKTGGEHSRQRSPPRDVKRD